LKVIRAIVKGKFQTIAVVKLRIKRKERRNSG